MNVTGKKVSGVLLALSVLVLTPSGASADSDFDKALSVSNSYTSQVIDTNGDLNLNLNHKTQGEMPVIAWHDSNAVYVGVQIPDGDYLYQSSFNVQGVGIERVRLPDGQHHHDEFFGDVIIYREQALVAASSDSLNKEQPIEVTFKYQGCSDLGICYQPQTTDLSVPYRSNPPGMFAGAIKDIPTSFDTSEQSLHEGNFLSGASDSQYQELLGNAPTPTVMLIFFLAGLGLTFTPCVLPMIPILSALIVGQKPSRNRAFILSSSYVTGTVATYTALGVMMGLFGSSMNIQAKLQSPWVLTTFAFLFAGLALSIMGVFSLRLPTGVAGMVGGWQNKAQKSGPLGIAVAGALSVLVVSPCVSAPLAGALVFISSTGDAATGGYALFSMSLGMGIPLLLVGTFGSSLLPKGGAWMNHVQTVFGLMMLGVSAWLIERVVPNGLSTVIWASLGITVAATLGVFDGKQSGGVGKFRQGLAVFPLVWSVALIMGVATGSTIDPLRPLATFTAMGAQSGEASPVTTVTTLNELHQIVEESSASGAPVFARITADWCSSCKVMERKLLEPDSVSALAGFRHVAIDITENTPNATEILNTCKVFGPPAMFFFKDGKKLDELNIQGETSSKHVIENLTLAAS